VLREGFASWRVNLFGLSRSLPTTLRHRYGTRPRARRSGPTSRRGRGRSRCRPVNTTCGARLLVILVLAIPVMVAANPIDPTWLAGFYDDADPDQLVSQALSPESWLSAALPVILCLLTTIAPVWLSRRGRRGADRSEQVARAPPGLAGTSTTRMFSIDPRYTERARLAHLTLRRSSSLRRFRRASTSGIDTAGVEEGEQGSPASSILPSSRSGTTKPSTNQCVEGFVCLALQPVSGRANTARAQESA